MIPSTDIHDRMAFLLHQAENPVVRQFWTDSMVALTFATGQRA